ncbi:hypothetical protein [Candidatus Methylospira mobilis]|uniref:hypothetical protein n=1 Tax=Candidatus Methylospira mobilis TaxID=1808979 RepID=UPI001884D1AB|nr:hypothetical protein [Candidatus Methylospira mobilis]
MVRKSVPIDFFTLIATEYYGQTFTRSSISCLIRQLYAMDRKCCNSLDFSQEKLHTKRHRSLGRSGLPRWEYMQRQWSFSTGRTVNTYLTRRHQHPFAHTGPAEGFFIWNVRVESQAIIAHFQQVIAPTPSHHDSHTARVSRANDNGERFMDDTKYSN